MKTLYILLLSVGLTACATPGSEINKLELGMSKGQVSAILGGPTDVVSKGKQVCSHYSLWREFKDRRPLNYSDRYYTCFEDGRLASYGSLEKSSPVRKAAEKGDRVAQHNLGSMYDNGNGVPQDFVAAAEWYRRAAEQGDSRAQFDLGSMYGAGTGVTLNHTTAAKWYRRAADQGLSEAQYMLALFYEKGVGVSKNYKEARRWYQRAAKQGNSAAQVKLGSMYDTGTGVTRDYSIAYMWYILASTNGDKDTARIRRMVERKLTKQQMISAQRRADKFTAIKE